MAISCGGSSIPSYTLGLIFICGVAVIWVGASHLIQYIFSDSGKDFDKPFFLTYFNTSNFSLWLFGFLVVPSWRRLPLKAPLKTKLSDTSSENEEDRAQDPEELDPILTPSSQPQSLTILSVARVAAHFAPFWLAANLVFNASLALTSVASNTILSTTSSLFVFLLSTIFFKERFVGLKLVAVFLTIGGACLVALMDKEDTEGTKEHPLLGDLLALCSAFLYACYTLVLERTVPDPMVFPTSMMFGFVGLLNVLLAWPIFLVFNATGVETFALPSSSTWIYFLLNSWVGTNLSDLLWAKSVLLTSPLVATLGLSLTIPFAMVSDIFWNDVHIGGGYLMGSCLVLAGFVLVNTAERLQVWGVRVCKDWRDRRRTEGMPPITS